jgi:hypothetical protein
MFKFTVAILYMAQLVSAASPEQPLAGQTDFQANSTIPFFVPGRYLRVMDVTDVTRSSFRRLGENGSTD